MVTQNFQGATPKSPHFSSIGFTADLEVPFPLFLPPPPHEASGASDSCGCKSYTYMSKKMFLNDRSLILHGKGRGPNYYQHSGSRVKNLQNSKGSNAC